MLPKRVKARIGRWTTWPGLRLNTDWQGYSDDFQDFASHEIEAVEQECDGMAWSAEVALGAYSALIFSQDGRGVG
jgi:hypothetical protein